MTLTQSLNLMQDVTLTTNLNSIANTTLNLAVNLIKDTTLAGNVNSVKMYIAINHYMSIATGHQTVVEGQMSITPAMSP